MEKQYAQRNLPVYHASSVSYTPRNKIDEQSDSLADKLFGHVKNPIIYDGSDIEKAIADQSKKGRPYAQALPINKYELYTYGRTEQQPKPGEPLYRQPERKKAANTPFLPKQGIEKILDTYQRQQTPPQQKEIPFLQTFLGNKVMDKIKQYGNPRLSMDPYGKGGLPNKSYRDQGKGIRLLEYKRPELKLPFKQ